MILTAAGKQSCVRSGKEGKGEETPSSTLLDRDPGVPKRMHLRKSQACVVFFMASQAKNFTDVRGRQLNYGKAGVSGNFAAQTSSLGQVRSDRERPILTSDSSFCQH